MYTYLLIILFLIIFTLLTWKNVRWGLFLITALLPVYLIRFSLITIPTTLLEAMIWILFIIWLVKMKKWYGLSFSPAIWLRNLKKKKSGYNPIPKILRLPIILLLVATTIAMWSAPDLRSASGIWKAYFIDPIMFLIVLVYTINTKEDLKNIIRLLGLTVLAIGIFALIQKLTGALIPNPFWATEETRRITTFFGYPNANALLVAPIIILTLINLFNKKNKYLLLDILIIIFGLLTVIWSGSTGALIGLTAGSLALLIFYPKTRLTALLIILAFSLGCNFYPAFKEKVSNQLAIASQIHLPLGATDLHIRMQQWRETWIMLKDQPILGSRLAGYQTAVTPYHQNDHVEIYLYPHNFFLNFWAETGLLGLIAVIWLLIAFFRLSYKKGLGLNICLASAMIVVLVHGLVDVPYFKNDLSVLFWLLIGLTIIDYNLRRGARVVESGALEKR
ncbi:MAG: hypothetical protein COU22_02310 [Candidatus Komeilibacteria bacterium CG10_big_fil_rev_8_21_14_0_10_41_13]|uniref:O-antigen ligase-related domain-containing protein n=1 Tax=Candidatus Komeilibacteria bacterium CG10_big_fil_rev_8_21_14_0_10_41_13 TaxID=1974476 RepID=A0A2M6WCG5_9BACT|nr:MAG: hypothetical protein COU22_02310 [Candidatus Komeilibacteria bacterium CG10_big_fil_rev_8_21_14_0_10_41_13]